MDALRVARFVRNLPKDYEGDRHLKAFMAPRVALLAERAENGFNLWTGEPDKNMDVEAMHRCHRRRKCKQCLELLRRHYARMSLTWRPKWHLISVVFVLTRAVY